MIRWKLQCASESSTLCTKIYIYLSEWYKLTHNFVHVHIQCYCCSLCIYARDISKSLGGIFDLYAVQWTHVACKTRWTRCIKAIICTFNQWITGLNCITKTANNYNFAHFILWCRWCLAFAYRQWHLITLHSEQGLRPKLAVFFVIFHTIWYRRWIGWC